MLQDRYGLEISTTSQQAMDHYIAGVDKFLAADPGAAADLSAATEADPEFALAHLALARTHQTYADMGGAKTALADARKAASGLSPREQGQFDTLALLIEGRSADGYRAARAHLADHPRDALVAQTCLGVFSLIGFSGRPGREAECLSLAEELAPHYGDDWWFNCLLGFARMEAGQPDQAARAIEISLAGNPRNANCAHYKSHLHYETGETEAGYAFLVEWMKDYDRRGLLHCHNSWHIALWALAQGDTATMWSVIDADIDPRATWGPPINVLTDMAAILYRAELAGVEVPPERWQVVSEFASRHYPAPGIAFVDMHAALAHAMAGKADALERIIRDAKGPVRDMVSDLGQAFGDIAAANWAGAVGHLTRAMADHARLGGSRAQRDLIEYALAGALMRMGKADEARRLLMMHRPRTATAGVVQGL